MRTREEMPPTGPPGTALPTPGSLTQPPGQVTGLWSGPARVCWMSGPPGKQAQGPVPGLRAKQPRRLLSTTGLRAAAAGSPLTYPDAGKACTRVWPVTIVHKTHQHEGPLPTT